MRKLTPVLVVDAIEPDLPFWERLGFSRTIEVPHGEVLGFAILASGTVEVMLQTRASVAADMPPLADALGASALFVEVRELAPYEKLTEEGGLDVYMPRRETFYGSTELGLRSPSGHFVTLAEFGEKA